MKTIDLRKYKGLEEVNPCPFCGSTDIEARVYQSKTNSHLSYISLSCKACNCQGAAGARDVTMLAKAIEDLEKRVLFTKDEWAELEATLDLVGEGYTRKTLETAIIKWNRRNNG